MSTTTFIRHARVDLALHRLRDDAGPILLLLHGLGERTPESVPPVADDWPGPVWGLDFTGHGDSTIPRGGGYTAELLLADADHALSHLGRATIFGRGLGGYVGMLAAGARPDRVRGVVAVDGPGLFGGGPTPGNRAVITLGDAPAVTPPDPYALVELSRDVRPPDYAMLFAHLAIGESDLDEPITLATINDPEWVVAVRGLPGVRSINPADALRDYAASYHSGS